MYTLLYLGGYMSRYTLGGVYVPVYPGWYIPWYTLLGTLLLHTRSRTARHGDAAEPGLPRLGEVLPNGELLTGELPC